MSERQELPSGLSPAEKRARLAELLRERATRPGPGAANPHTRTAPLSSVQERIWFFEQLQPGTSTFHISITLSLNGPLDVSALERAFEAVIRRHDTLRTAIRVEDGVPVQHVAASVPNPVPFELCDATTIPEPLRAKEARRLVKASTRALFDFGNAPLVRARLIRLAADAHLLALTFHHMAGDAWSIRVLADDLARLYSSAVTGVPVPLPVLDVHYPDIATRQKRALATGAYDADISYWRDQLAGAPETTELPPDCPRGNKASGGAMTSLRLSVTVSRHLKELGRARGATLFMTLLAGLDCLLARFTGQNDLVVGSPVSGRTAESESLVGCFVDTVALRTDLSGDPTFVEVLQRVRQTCLEAYAHQDVPFDKVVEALNPRRDPHRTPVFQILFNMLLPPKDGVEMHGLTVEPGFIEDELSKFDFTVYVTEESDGILMRVMYNSALFRDATIGRLLDAFEDLLVQISANVDARLSSFSIGSTRARAVLPDPVARLDSAPAGNVAADFVATAARHRDRTAICHGDIRISYAELDDRSAALAGRLVSSGFGAESMAAVCARRNPDLIVALLGVLRAGGAFVLVDPAQPAARSIECLGTLHPHVWIEIEGTPAVPTELRRYVNQLSLADRIDLCPDPQISAGIDRDVGYARVPEAQIGADALAYVAFTSGSTGRPKGIAGEHRPLAHFVAWQRDTFGFSPSDRFSLLSGLLHDPMLRDVFTPLVTGAAVVIPEADDLVSPERMAAWLANKGITVAHLTPPLMRFIAQESARSSRPLALRYVFFGGDSLRWDDVARLVAIAPGARVVNFYGATETPQAMAYHVVGDAGSAMVAENASTSMLVPVGRGIDGVQLLIVNGGRQCGIGEPGEIWIRTSHLARGYLDADQTAERFFESSFSGIAGDRVYRTGDRGRYLGDGSVQFLGRTDDQLKIRGFRIEPAEIERVLREQPLVHDAVVVARDGGVDGPLLAAYVASGAATLSTGALRAALAQRLPEYMVPSAFVLLDKMPLSPNGKIDRRALAVAAVPIHREETFVAPRNELEAAIADIWRSLLGVDRVGIHDNFFTLGGHSLLAIRVVSKLREALQLEPSLKTLFERPTVAGLAETLLEQLLEQDLDVSPGTERLSLETTD